MRIAILAPGEFRGPCPSGTDIYICGLVESLCGLGHSVYVFCPHSRGLPLHEVRDAVNIHRCEIMPSDNFGDWNERLSRAIAERFAVVEAEDGRFDIINVHDWPGARAALRCSRFHDTPLVFTLHSLEHLRNAEWENSPEAKLIHEIEGECVSQARALVASSQRLSEDMAEAWNHGKDCRVIIPGASSVEHKTPEGASDLKKRLGMEEWMKPVLFASPLEYRTGPDLLMEAAPEILGKHPEARLIFIGHGPMRRELEMRCRELGIGWGVLFHENIFQDELFGIISISDALVCPARHEPLNPCIAEAWALGTPVVAGEGGPAEYVWHATTGLHVYNRPESVAWGVLRLLDDPKFSDWLSSNARVAAETTFSWQTTAQKTLELFQQI